MKNPNKNTANIELLDDYHKIIKGIRIITKHLVDNLAVKIANDRNFTTVVDKSNRAAQTLHKMSSILSNILALELSLIEKKAELIVDKPLENTNLNAAELTLIFNMVKEWGLLKENSEDIMNDLIKHHENLSIEVSNE